ncbi:hypothetical protein ACWD3L_33555, partial [Streptomyces sp. NPDC002587]
MSDTQGSHRRGGPVPEAYEPVARTAGPGYPQTPVPRPRGGDRRAARRRARGGPAPAAWPDTGGPGCVAGDQDALAVGKQVGDEIGDDVGLA